jgi:hypothetical protein
MPSPTATGAAPAAPNYDVNVNVTLVRANGSIVFDLTRTYNNGAKATFYCYDPATGAFPPNPSGVLLAENVPTGWSPSAPANTIGVKLELVTLDTTSSPLRAILEITQTTGGANLYSDTYQAGNPGDWSNPTKWYKINITWA